MFLLSLQKTYHCIAKANQITPHFVLNDDSHGQRFMVLIPSYSGNEVIPENKLCAKERRRKNIENFKLPLQR